MCLQSQVVLGYLSGGYWTLDTHWSLIISFQGDSGSGLIVVSDTGPVLVGVVSYGWDCGDNRYKCDFPG